jgi:RNA polymerase sigma-70 factor, ECF subfamily
MSGQRSRHDRTRSRSHGPGEEASLIASSRQGEKEAIAELYHRHVDVIYRYVYARVRDAAVAEDLTAQVFLKAIEGLANYEPSGTPFLGWLYRIAHARTVDHWRQHGRRREVPLTDNIPSSGSWVEAIDDQERWITAIDLLAQLTDDQQEVMILRFMGEMSLSEVALILNKTVNAVKAIQHRALASLARLLERRSTGYPDERRF